MKGNSALQSGLLRRVHEEVASLNGQSAACVFFDMEKFYDSACLYKLIDLAMARDFPRRLLYIAMQAYLSDRILRAGDMVMHSIQPSNGILAGCSLGHSFARVIFYNILDSVNNVLPAQLPAPVETRQFVDDLTTSSVANNEDDVTRSICSVALELRHELEAAKLTLNTNKSMIISNRQSLAKRVQRILRANDLHIPVADITRDLGIDAAGGARKRRRTRNQRLRAARRRGSRVKVLARKNRKAVKLYTTGIWPSIAYGVEQYGLSPTDLKQFRATAAACSGVGGLSTLPSHRYRNWSGPAPKFSSTSAPLHFLLVAPFLG